jgi:hypothetical protein
MWGNHQKKPNGSFETSTDVATHVTAKINSMNEHCKESNQRELVCFAHGEYCDELIIL